MTWGGSICHDPGTKSSRRSACRPKTSSGPPRILTSWQNWGPSSETIIPCLDFLKHAPAFSSAAGHCNTSICPGSSASEVTWELEARPHKMGLAELLAEFPLDHLIHGHKLSLHLHVLLAELLHDESAPPNKLLLMGGGGGQHCPWNLQRAIIKDGIH